MAGTTRVEIDMAGKVALVTGGGYGMGRASALRFAACGAAVVVADLDADTGKQTVEIIRAAGGTAEFVQTDVGDPDAVRAMATFVESVFGGLDYAHNNAGIVQGQDPVASYPLDQWERVIRTNLTGVFLCLKYEIPLLLAQGGGAVVNVASEAAFKGNVADIGYTASKHGVVGLTAAAALQYARRGIRVNAVAPGNIATGITERARDYLSPEQYHRMETAMPLRRLGRAEEVAELVVWLCSDAASLVNGATVAVDSGWHVA